MIYNNISLNNHLNITVKLKESKRLIYYQIDHVKTENESKSFETEFSSERTEKNQNEQIPEAMNNMN
jgi:hypothetical protein